MTRFCQMGRQLGKSWPRLTEGVFGHMGLQGVGTDRRRGVEGLVSRHPAGGSQWRAAGRWQRQEGVFSAHLLCPLLCRVTANPSSV